MSSYDVAIAGAGPAGSALALLMARAGYRVLLIEKSRFDKLRFGETAPPELRSALARIGLEHLAASPFCIDAPEVVSVWGSDIPQSRNHIFSPYGMALHLDRRAFDEALALAARDAGADLRTGYRARVIASSVGYDVDLSNGESVRVGSVAMATGRVGGQFGLPYRRRYLDNNVAICARFAGGHDSRTFVEAIAGGWFYAASLPSQETVAVFVTSAALVPANRVARLRWWQDALNRTTIVRKALYASDMRGALTVIDARSSYADVVGGENWITVGDARIAPDPLSGVGICWAIDDAVSVMDLLSGATWPEAARELRARTERDVSAYSRQRSRIYAGEHRFDGDAYWSHVVSGQELAALA